jgi:hypothetical protein
MASNDEYQQRRAFVRNGKIRINGKETSLSDITTDTSKSCDIGWVIYNNGKITHEYLGELKSKI